MQARPDSPTNAPPAVAAFVNYVGEIKKVGDTCWRAIAL